MPIREIPIILKQQWNRQTAIIFTSHLLSSTEGRGRVSCLQKQQWKFASQFFLKIFNRRGAIFCFSCSYSKGHTCTPGSAAAVDYHPITSECKSCFKWLHSKSGGNSYKGARRDETATWIEVGAETKRVSQGGQNQNLGCRGVFEGALAHRAQVCQCC